jgi:tryptophan synthase alpha chain
VAIDFKKKPGIVAYLTAGDPDLATTRDIALAAIDNGADVIELGVPFSDPLADGPVIQRASQRAVARGTRLTDVLGLAKELRATRPSCGLVLFSYLNPVIRMDQAKANHRETIKEAARKAGPILLESAVGMQTFCAAAADAGVDGVLLTDMIVEEAGEYLEAMRAHRLAPVFLAAPTSTDARLKAIAAVSRGFVYAISRVGITGTQQNIAGDAPELVARLRQHTTLPIAVGFGISNAEHVKAVGEFADAAVIGSALVALIEKTPANEAAITVGRFIAELRT